MYGLFLDIWNFELAKNLIILRHLIIFQKVNAKFFLIHGIDDETVPIEQAEELYNSSNKDNTTLWKIEGKAHSDCNHHPEFWPKVLEFFKIPLIIFLIL